MLQLDDVLYVCVILDYDKLQFTGFCVPDRQTLVPKCFFLIVVYYQMGVMYSCVKGAKLHPESTCVSQHPIKDDFFLSNTMIIAFQQLSLQSRPIKGYVIEVIMLSTQHPVRMTILFSFFLNSHPPPLYCLKLGKTVKSFYSEGTVLGHVSLILWFSVMIIGCQPLLPYLVIILIIE